MSEWTCPACGRGSRARNARHSCVRRTPEQLFAPYPEAYPLYEAVRDVLLPLGGVEVEATRTQAAFRAGRRFAYLWMPHMSLKGGARDLHLTFDLPRRVGSPRIKQAVESRPGLWTHHVRLDREEELDADVRAWLREAHRHASRP